MESTSLAVTELGDTTDWVTSTLLADRGAKVLHSGIKPVRAGWRVHGRALTVSVAAGDNLAIHAALSLARPGDVLVVAAEGLRERAVMGGIMCTQAGAAGLAGVVIDGAIRDTAELRDGALPVFALGASPAGPHKHGPGSVLRPVTCGGVAIEPGDWIFADDDGVVAYAEEDREALLRSAAEKLAAEQKRMDAIARGELTPAWLDEALARHPIDIGHRDRF